MHKNVPDEMKLDLPVHCSEPTRVVQFLNMVSLEDLIDIEAVESIRKDVLDECLQYG